MNRKAWLVEIPWELVVWQNEQLCSAKHAHHGPTSDGYEATRELWKSHHLEEMDLLAVADLCRKCHRLAPFTSYNGNTFAAIIRALIDPLDLEPRQAALGRSLACHIVAGVAGDEEVRAFREFCESLG
ncbi:hypothetical protein OKA05_23395 [Luteolibacter arcticus]|uniref:HNH endonuclease n=1 Tax=Luteolibacter arcticus TaxID=1581411 RepID=A0ABT3GPT9_9BACT|nr:hypothetical protein [Luteolibacter arcticus]MCW1925523.1 hypothetical protein [Luteolibacter arcticus]